MSLEKVGYVNVIARGYASGGLTRHSRKKYLYTLKNGTYVTTTVTCPTMTFKDNPRPIQTPQDDSLVVEMRIANLRVAQVLIDNGSFADIITMDCLSKSKYREADLTPIDQSLLGFGG